MEINRNNCAICNGNLKNIYSLNNVPITLSCVENIEKLKYSNMSFSQCCSCNTIQLDKLIPLEILYSNSHNYNSVGETWKGYLEDRRPGSNADPYKILRVISESLSLADELKNTLHVMYAEINTDELSNKYGTLTNDELLDEYKKD